MTRVWLSNASLTPELGSDGPCRIQPADWRGGGQARRVAKLAPVKVSPAPGGFKLGTERFQCAALDVRPEGRGKVTVDGRPYPGSIRVIRAGERVAVINIVDIETYLAGVVGGEMPANWPREALKAQAVAARTYALSFQQGRTDAEWDLTSTVEDQVYRGGPPQRSVLEAVNATRGQVLLHEGRLFPAFFHSTCGGHTESPGVTLAKPEFDFLEGVPCEFCAKSPYAEWSERISRRELSATLALADGSVGSLIIGVLVTTGENSSGRAVKVSWSGGETLVPIVDFRRAVGWMRVKSGRFECRVEGDALVFAGRGLGHGAGMCQYGCKGMAEAGYTYDRILAHYYRNTVLEKAY
jgi:stage II sporulation protein D